MNFKKKKSNKCQYINLFAKLVDLLPIEDDNLEMKLIKNFSDIIKVLEIERNDKFKYIYFNKTIIHKILYDLEKIIDINEEYLNYLQEFDNLFYLDLVILSNPDIINYTINKKVISKIVFIIKNLNNKLLLTISQKIIIDLINNYKSCNSYDEMIDEKELNDIEKECKNIITNNFEEFQKIGVSFSERDFYYLKVDEIYTEILKALIKYKKLEDYKNTCGILSGIKLEKIYITKLMFVELNKLLNTNNKFIEPYLITKMEDLFDIKIINFYYSLIKYIFKNPFYYFQIPILLNIRNIIIFIIRNCLDSLFYFKLKYEKDTELIERIDYIIKKITDSEYYYGKYINQFKLCKLKSILFFYKIFFFESEKKEIKEIENIIKNESNDNLNEKYEFFMKNHINEKIENRLNIINNVYDLTLNIGDLFLNQKRIKNIFQGWRLIEKIIREKKIARLKKDIKVKLIFLMENENILNSFKNIFTEKELSFFMKEVEIASKNKIIKKENTSKLIAKANESMNIHFNSKIEESSIEIQSYDISIYSKSHIEENKNLDEKSIYQKVEKIYFPTSFQEKFQKSQKHKIIEHCDIIGKHENAEFIRQLSDGGFVSGGNDKYLIWYDKLFRKIESIFVKEYQVNLYEIGDNNNQEEQINIISLSDSKINFINLNPNTQISKIKGKLTNSSIISVHYINEEYSLILATDKIGKFHNKWDKYTANIEKILDIKNFYKGGILLKTEIEKIFFLTSNDIIPKGVNKMIIYNYSKNEIVGNIEGYSFIPSYNNLCEIHQKIIPEKKLILAACTKKENDIKKYGILVINLKLNGKIEFNSNFFCTGNFEVYCFCQISNVDNNNSIYGNIANKELINITDTEYFLVGGLDPDKRGGSIKLFKIKHNNFEQNLEIQQIQDIFVDPSEQFKGFEGTISSIIQSKITGNILITCWDGNVHLFKPPNVDDLAF